MNKNELILTEASIEEIDQAIGELGWTSKYEVTERSSEIAIAALQYVRDIKVKGPREEVEENNENTKN